MGKALSSRRAVVTGPLSFEPHAGDSTILICSTPILRENTLGVVKGLPPLSPSTNLTRGLAARRLFRVPRCREGTVHLQTSMPLAGFEPRPYDIAVSVAIYAFIKIYLLTTLQGPIIADIQHHLSERNVHCVPTPGWGERY
ncbi:hypothetical protein TNCV_3554351 [Trichonephila clavipes]|nr:hypothetical protein TNCV_3554351 [Trichonephila clavipes]